MPSKRKTRRLDGKDKLVRFTRPQEESIRSYCREHGIKSECEFIRQAVVSFIDRQYDDDTLDFTPLGAHY